MIMLSLFLVSFLLFRSCRLSYVLVLVAVLPTTPTCCSNLSSYDTNLDWTSARQHCETEKDKRLASTDPTYLGDIGDLLTTNSSAWLGGRLVNETWAWADNTQVPLYDSLGCFSDTVLDNLTTRVPSGELNILQCFEQCRTEWTALQGGKCKCLTSDPSNSTSQKLVTSCSRVCPQDFNEHCGGVAANTVFVKDSPELHIGPPANDPKQICGYLHVSTETLRFDRCDTSSIRRRGSLCQNCSISPVDGDRTCVISYVSTSFTWHEADKNCKDTGQSLATASTGDLKKWLASHQIVSSGYLWLGVRREPRIRWSNGTTSDPSAVANHGGDCVAVEKDLSGTVSLSLQDCKVKKNTICATVIPTTQEITTAPNTENTTALETNLTTDAMTDGTTYQTSDQTTDGTTDQTTDVITDQTTDVTTFQTTDVTTDQTTDQTVNVATDQTTDQ
ncbi:uncharacterized protein LOC101861846, partial [Aplysia californica]|uniref:Uncharacterized protein LOC101861846 n=1 Tax=Aplysia californica TaxID=6500 RepID=A0ABM1AA83_APLCA